MVYEGLDLTEALLAADFKTRKGNTAREKRNDPQFQAALRLEMQQKNGKPQGAGEGQEPPSLEQLAGFYLTIANDARAKPSEKMAAMDRYREVMQQCHEEEKDLDQYRGQLAQLKQEVLLDQAKALRGEIEEPKVEPAKDTITLGSGSWLQGVAVVKPEPAPEYLPGTGDKVYKCGLGLHGKFRGKSKFDQCPGCITMWGEQNAAEERRMGRYTMPADRRA